MSLPNYSKKLMSAMIQIMGRHLYDYLSLDNLKGCRVP